MGVPPSFVTDAHICLCSSKGVKVGQKQGGKKRQESI